MLSLTSLFISLCAPILVRSSLRGTAQANEKNGVDAYYISKMSDRFVAFMENKRVLMDQFGASEQDRLENAILSASRPEDKSLLERTAKVNEERRLEAQNAFNEMQNFATTLKQIIGAVGSASTCQDLTCGPQSYCSMDKALGARCLCKAGFEGNGFICQTPLQFTAMPILQNQVGQARNQFADLHVSTLQGNIVMAVYRDISKGHKGFAMLGHASDAQMKWHAPVLFSQQSQAYSPVLVQLMDGDQNTPGGGGIAIAYRTTNRGGDAILLGGHVDATSGALTLGRSKAFARNQAQAMQMIPLSDSRVAVIFAEHLLQGHADQVLGGAMYGAALLAHVDSNGDEPAIISKNRFATGPVARFSVVALSPTTFGVAYRQGAAEEGSKMAEAACILGEALPGTIRFNSNAVLLEPDQAHIWARSLTLVGKDRMAYTYHSGDEKVTKQAILQADPSTHRLEVVHGPEVLGQGFNPVVHSVSNMQLDSQSNLDPDRQSVLLTILGRDGSTPGEAHLCRISHGGIPSGCRTLALGARDLVSVSGAPVGDGRFVFTMTDAHGIPYYELVGLSS